MDKRRFIVVDMNGDSYQNGDGRGIFTEEEADGVVGRELQDSPGNEFYIAEIKFSVDLVKPTKPKLIKKPY